MKNGTSRTNDNQNELILGDTKCVARIFVLSVRQVERLTASGKIPGAMKVGGARRYHLPTVLKHLEEQAKKSVRR